MSEYRSVNFYELCRLCAASQGEFKCWSRSLLPVRQNKNKRQAGVFPYPRQISSANAIALLGSRLGNNSRISRLPGTKVNLFSDNGRKQQLVAKIAECLPVAVDENDSLPKTICELCVQQLQLISEYRQKCVNTQTMLEGCLGTNKLKNEGRVSCRVRECLFELPLLTSLSFQVYIKDEAARAGPGGCKPAINIVTLKNSPVKPTLVPLATQQQQQTQQVTQVDSSPMTMSGNDYLNNLVGIKVIGPVKSTVGH